MDERTDNQPTPETTEPAQQEATSDEIAALRAESETHRQRADQLARAYAEVLNERDSFRRRVERERDRQVESARSEVAGDLLDALDDLRRALASDTRDPAALFEGVELIAEGLQRRLEGMGLQQVPALGHYFDPQVHEAVDLVVTHDRESDGKVVEEVRSGWKAGERVVRPARVRVARFAPAPEPT